MKGVQGSLFLTNIIATLLWLEYLKFISRSFSQCRTQRLAWCPECAVVSTSLQSLKTYIGCLSAREWSSRQRCWSGSVFAVSLQSTSGTSAFPLHSSKAPSVCDLPLLELYWFHALRQRSFAINGLTVWNSLPPALRSPDLSQNTFKRALRTHLFSSVQRH